MADGTLRISPSAKDTSTRELSVQVDDSDLDMLEQGTLRILRVSAKVRLDGTPGHYRELEVNGESLPIVELTIDTKRGTSAIVTVG